MNVTGGSKSLYLMNNVLRDKNMSLETIKHPKGTGNAPERHKDTTRVVINILSANGSKTEPSGVAIL